MKFIPALMVLFLLAACGDTPFDEDYWDDNLDAREEEQSEAGFGADLSPVSALSFTNADASIDISGNSANIRIEMQGIPQNISQGPIQIMDASCQTLVVQPPTTGSIETKNISYTENGTRASLFSDATSNDGLIGKSLVVYATSGSSTIFPIACGPIVQGNPRVGTGTGTVTGTNSGTFTGGTLTGGTLNGGTLNGGTLTGGSTAGTVGGTAAGTTGFTIGGVNGELEGDDSGIDPGLNGGGFATAGTSAGTTVGTAPGSINAGTAAGINAGTSAGGFTAGTPPGTASGFNAGAAAGTNAGTVGTTFGGSDGR